MKITSQLIGRPSLAAIAVFTAVLAQDFNVRAQTNEPVLTTNSLEFVLTTPQKFTLEAVTFGRLHARLEARMDAPPLAFNQAAVKQSTAAARRGPDPEKPYFTVRFALPVPPEDATNTTAVLAGVDPAAFTHNHSPGFEILPNGDALAIYFSTPPGQIEAAPTTTFIQARLRHGAEEWDPPELFFDVQGGNDQSAMLWKDGKKIWFFGGGRGVTPWLPFKIATSTDNGVSWIVSLPQLDRPATDFTAQPISSAFRSPDGAIYMAMDAAREHSFLWRSLDDGAHWSDMGGRTGGRHSVIEPLDNNGTLLSIGGKNTATNGYSPQNISTDWGRTWSADQQSPFPALGSHQRPSLVRLANRHLCFVSDSYERRAAKSPAGWAYGEGGFIAISKDNGASWRFKRLPVALPHDRDQQKGTLGYATVRQAPNGVIHILATMAHPCLHYELNEAWVFSNAGDVQPETRGGTVEKFTENYPGGGVRAAWSARICPNGRYLLDGPETTYYENGRKEHEVTYASGRKTGMEAFWSPDGKKLWTWECRVDRNIGTWTQYWPNGKKRVESSWSTHARARDLDRNFFGLVAEGPAWRWNEDGSPAGACSFTNGVFAGSLPPKGG